MNWSLEKSSRTEKSVMRTKLLRMNGMNRSPSAGFTVKDSVHGDLVAG